MPSRRLSQRLSEAISELESISRKAQGQLIDLESVGDRVMKGPLAHLWSEYTETLHPQREDDQTGQSRIVRYRSTTIAETYFSDQALIEAPLHADYFKHVPGILTGLGIIGTFAGLIQGLSQFNVTLNPQETQAQLGNLFKAVWHAFLVSGFAIALAMLVTWLEKSHIALCSRRAEKLRELIDGLFKSGAGEEYLERLVRAAETSATQAGHIKDALVADMREILTTLNTQQIEAQSRHTTQMSGDVGRAISENLGPSMRAISDAVEGVSTNQGDAINRLLTDVLTSFSGQMQDMFGSQLQGMASLLRQTSDSMALTAAQFGQLAGNIRDAGAGTVDEMGRRLTETIAAVDARQQSMNAQMTLFIDQIRSVVAESQTESNNRLQQSLSSVSEQVALILKDLHQQTEAVVQSQAQRQERFESSTSKAIGTFSDQVEKLLEQSAKTNSSLQGTVASLASTTGDAISRMNSGAELLYVGASDFAKAGAGVADTMRASAGVVESMRTASAQLSLASESLKGVVKDYSVAGDSFATTVSELKGVIDTARRDASITSELVGRLEDAAAQLVAAQGQSEDYLKGVNQVLTEAHRSFAESIERTLREGNKEFHKELATAIQLLSGAIKNLGDVVDDIPARR